MQISPSDGFFSPTPVNRASNRWVLSLSSSFRQTFRPMVRSYALNTLDMLPCPVRPLSSNRLAMSTRLPRLPPPPLLLPKRKLSKPTVGPRRYGGEIRPASGIVTDKAPGGRPPAPEG